jgi:hypothetical protein
MEAKCPTGYLHKHKGSNKHGHEFPNEGQDDKVQFLVEENIGNGRGKHS